MGVLLVFCVFYNLVCLFFFFNDTATTEIYTLSLHDALPICSGVATTVTMGSVAYPMLAKAGYGKDAAGGLLAAGGLGAILSPPVLGAAAFLIAEFLKISYLDVILMATIPTILYYLSIFIMVEMDARKFNMKNVAIDKHATAWELTKHFGFHFLSLIAIVVFMLI